MSYKHYVTYICCVILNNIQILFEASRTYIRIHEWIFLAIYCCAYTIQWHHKDTTLRRGARGSSLFWLDFSKYYGNKTLFYVSFAKETWHSCFRCVSRPILQKHDKVLNFEWLMLPGISVSMWDRIHRACAYELYSQQTVSTHQRCSS